MSAALSSDANRPAGARVPGRPAATPARLRRRADIEAVFAEGTPVHGRVASVRARRRSMPGPPRCTVVAGRRLGSAVRRNRVRRRVRSALRELAIPGAADYVVVARPAARTTPFTALRAELADLVHAAWLRAGGD